MTTEFDKIVYLDYAATTPPDPRVVEAMHQCLMDDGEFANPASVVHAPGRRALRRVELARSQLAASLGASADQIIFTSGATESNNLAIAGTVQAAGVANAHVITAKTEHKAVLDVVRALQKQGCAVSYLKPGPQGTVSADQVAQAITERTVLVSLMQVNNETGLVQDVSAIGAVCEQRGVLFHVDAAQSIGKVAVDLASVSIDLMSFSAHKVYGPKGIGALYLRDVNGQKIKPLMHGGGQEFGLRPGTLATHQIVGMAVAFEIAAAELEKDQAHLQALTQRMWRGISDLDKVSLNVRLRDCAPGYLNACFAAVHGEALVYALRQLALTGGSACTSASAEPSYVLRALGKPDHLAESSLRISFGRTTTQQQVDTAIQIIRREYQRLLRLEPVQGINQGL